MKSNITNFLNSKSVELKSNKIELGAIQDLEKSFRKEFSDSKSADGDISKAISVIERTKNMMNNIFKGAGEIEARAKELGVDVEEIDNIMKVSKDVSDRMDAKLKLLSKALTM